MDEEANAADAAVKVEDGPKSEPAKPNPAPAAKPEPAAKAANAKQPMPHEIAAAMNHDPVLALDVVLACANHENNRRCPALFNIVQSYQINKQEMVDWLERVAIRNAERAARK